MDSDSSEAKEEAKWEEEILIHKKFIQSPKIYNKNIIVTKKKFDNPKVCLMKIYMSSTDHL